MNPLLISLNSSSNKNNLLVSHPRNFMMPLEMKLNDEIAA
jgi:hypothetical protein